MQPAAMVTEDGKSRDLSRTELSHYVADCYRSGKSHIIMADGLRPLLRIINNVLPVVFPEGPRSDDLATITFKIDIFEEETLFVGFILIKKERIAADDLAKLLGLTYRGKRGPGDEEPQVSLFIRASCAATSLLLQHTLNNMVVLDERSAEVN